MARSWLRVATGAIVLIAGLGPGVRTAAGQYAPSEYQLKAVFLFNFAQFADWPAGAFATPEAPLVIGVLGDDPFGSYLDETVRGETVDGHPLVIERYRRVEEIGNCHILFVTRTEAENLAPVLNQLRERAILTVSDAEQFAARGGIIQFVMDRNRVRLRISLEAAERAHVTLSSKLLRSAEIVGRKGE